MDKQGSTTLISSETIIDGDIHFCGTVHIEGRVKGNVSADQGLLTIAHNGSVEGNVRVQRVVVDGHVRGNVYAEEHLELASRAVITGNVFYNVIEMTKGAQVNGNLEHHANGVPVGPQPLLERSDDKVPAGEVIDVVES
ncbi:polymer-forming cytoskeletal protein [Endozoicomonas sp. SCSIO W0465]|uniref:bactofilin family protein n=1 Tax=Endozoicomonas sp. SCSIO W0465 TaxID=2918516 RepID=UPI002074E3FA|nr:polymer-forming cytoskeletal protein [Endozoicomonas sp. SCSIO W0465]USE38466.1 polymer-forming cytoskeletal protein [Endozoicomonas sp. SCSIO W0465]